MESQFVFWPSVNEREKLEEEISNELQGCIGWVDGTDIKLATAPWRKDKDGFFDKDKVYNNSQKIMTKF